MYYSNIKSQKGLVSVGYTYHKIITLVPIDRPFLLCHEMSFAPYASFHSLS